MVELHPVDEPHQAERPLRANAVLEITAILESAGIDQGCMRSSHQEDGGSSPMARREENHGSS